MACQRKSAQRFFFSTPTAVSPLKPRDCFSTFLQPEKKVFCFKCNASRSSTHPEGTPHLCSSTCNNPPSPGLTLHAVDTPWDARPVLLTVGHCDAGTQQPAVHPSSPQQEFSGATPATRKTRRKRMWQFPQTK